MPSARRYLVLLWLLTFGMFVLTESGMVAASWLVLFLALAAAGPTLVLWRQDGAIKAAPERLDIVATIGMVAMVADERDDSGSRSIRPADRGTPGTGGPSRFGA